MPEFRILTDEELKNIYEEAQRRTNASLDFGQNRIREEQLKEEKRYADALKKYEDDMKIYKKRYEEEYQQFLVREEKQRKFHEQMQDNKIKSWEQHKQIREKQGKTVDEATRPQRQPYRDKKFYYSGFVPKKPEKKDYIIQ